MFLVRIGAFHTAITQFSTTQLNKCALKSAKFTNTTQRTTKAWINAMKTAQELWSKKKKHSASQKSAWKGGMKRHPRNKLETWCALKTLTQCKSQSGQQWVWLEQLQSHYWQLGSSNQTGAKCSTKDARKWNQSRKSKEKDSKCQLNLE